MGIKTTHLISRHTAEEIMIRELSRRIAQVHFMSDAALEDELETLPGSHFRDYRITSSIIAEDYEHPCIRSPEDF